MWSDDVDGVRRLLAEGAAVDEYGDGVVDKTPLMESVDEVEEFYDDDRASITALLLEHGAEVERRDQDGRTALHHAAGAGRRAVQLLLEAGAQPNVAAADGTTPLHEAVRWLNVGAVEALCRAGADPRAPDGSGRTALDLLEPEDDEGQAVRDLLRAATG